MTATRAAAEATYNTAKAHYAAHCKNWPAERLQASLEKTAAAVADIPNCNEMVKLFALGKRDAMKALLEEKYIEPGYGAARAQAIIDILKKGGAA